MMGLYNPPPAWTRIHPTHDQTWPPLDEDVLLSLLGGGIIVGCLALAWDGDEGGALCRYVYAEPGGGSTPLDAEPTHWMPLPVGPEEERA